ncbi:MAG: helix-turn-helix transcriptional regulator [Gammaproteobacteria bacterium]|nr:helix-turn-helix transcriptional regulator [Gammaproteobacteria bacterium]
MPTPHHPPAAARRALRQLGADIREARLRRNLTMQIVAERAFTSRSTLQRVENGDPGVSIGIYAAVLHTLGLLEGLRETAHINNDEIGQALAAAALPKRARSSRRGRL